MTGQTILGVRYVLYPMSWNGIYAFDAADAELTLLPMAARRALDCAGRHLSLLGWQGLPLVARRTLVTLGAASEVDALAVARCLTEKAPWLASNPCCAIRPPISRRSR